VCFWGINFTLTPIILKLLDYTVANLILYNQVQHENKIMKNEFKAFYSPTEEDFSNLWEKAYFVFDTSILLDLYRYQESTTDQLMNVLEHLKDKIHIPYHVAIEYQRNRINVIADQNNKFSDVKNIVEKGIKSITTGIESLSLEKRHSMIEPNNFIEELKSVQNKFIQELNELEKKHHSIVGEDKIRDKLDTLLKGKIGKMPSKEIISELEKEAKTRFEKKIPPGYLDNNKDKEKSNEATFSYHNLTYQRKYSDYLVWKQTIDFAKDENITDLIFVTNDNKEDWWLKHKGQTISPRIELIEEILREASLERFHMYNLEGFLKYAGEAYKLDTSEAIKEVKDIATILPILPHNRKYSSSVVEHSTQKAVYDWLIEKYGEQYVTFSDNKLDLHVDIIVSLDGVEIAFAVKAIYHPHIITDQSFNNLKNLATFYMNTNQFHKFVVVFVTFDDSHIQIVKNLLDERIVDLRHITVYLGVANLNQDTGIATDLVILQ
jgi:hypothetical protein